MYFKDLTTEGDQLVRVGWLSAEHPFPTGDMDPVLLRELVKVICGEHVNEMKGEHYCEFCPGPPHRHSVTYRREETMLGCSDIQVVTDDAAYLAPTLILHYVVEHNYLPPQEFLDALAARRTDDIRIAELNGRAWVTWGPTEERTFSVDHTIRELEEMTGMHKGTGPEAAKEWAAWLVAQGK